MAALPSQDAREVCSELWTWVHEGGPEPLVAPEVRERFYELLREWDAVLGGRLEPRHAA